MADLQTYGIDISSYSKQIDWAKVVTNLNPRFVLARATHMTGDATDPYEDTLFSNYWSAMAAHGLLRGAYAFCHPLADAKATTDKFFDVYKPQPGDLVPALDIEDIWDNSCPVPVQARIGLIKTMVDAVSSRIGGQKPMIYTKTRVWNDLGNPAQFANCPLWILNYQTMPTALNMPPTWPAFAFWQYAQNLLVDGIEGDYDPNLFNGPEADLKKYVIQKVTA